MDVLLSKISARIRELPWAAEVNTEVKLESYDDESCCFVLNIRVNPHDDLQDSIGFLTEIPLNSIDSDEYMDELINYAYRVLNESYLEMLH